MRMDIDMILNVRAVLLGAGVDFLAFPPINIGERYKGSVPI